MSTQNQNTNVTIFEEMLGKTFNRIEVCNSGDRSSLRGYFDLIQKGSKFRYTLESTVGFSKTDVLVFVDSDGPTLHLFQHSQDCCESVYLEDIIGDLADLIGYPLLQAELVTEESTTDEWGNSQTWSFYKFATVKGSVTFRWYGESNGYYSETVEYYQFIKQ